MIYYLHQRQTNLVLRDPEGSEHADLASATAEAVEAAREMLADAARVGRDIGDWMIEIADDHGRVLSSVPFSSVLRREPKRAA